MLYNHGINIIENPTTIDGTIITTSGVQVVIGTGPINLVKDITKVVNEPIIAYSWYDAVQKLGYSDDWDKYTLCQSMDANFKRFKIAPVVFINVLDPNEHIMSAEKLISINAGISKIEDEGILLDENFVVKNSDGTISYERDKDYVVAFNKQGHPLLSVLKGGSIPNNINELSVTFNKLDVSKVTDEDIIGGYDAINNRYTGLELISQVYPRLGVVPGLILAPGWSHKPQIATVIDIKSEKINGNFNAMNILDIDCVQVNNYQNAPEWKHSNNYTNKHSIVCYPKVKIGEKIYWYSSIIAALIALTDAENENVPYKSPSNKKIHISATVLADGTELYLDQLQANFLNGAGIMTAINMNGWRSWGNNTAAYPENTDPKDRFIPIRRVFDWWGNNFILNYFDKIDDPTNLRLIESIVDNENIRGNGFQAKGQIAGAKIDFRQQDNPVESILNGSIQFIQKISAFPPAENIINILEFDPTILSNSIFGGGQ